jgi:hypothetical protein
MEAAKLNAFPKLTTESTPPQVASVWIGWDHFLFPTFHHYRGRYCRLHHSASAIWKPSEPGYVSQPSVWQCIGCFHQQDLTTRIGTTRHRRHHCLTCGYHCWAQKGHCLPWRRFVILWVSDDLQWALRNLFIKLYPSFSYFCFTGCFSSTPFFPGSVRYVSTSFIKASCLSVHRSMAILDKEYGHLMIYHSLRIQEQRRSQLNRGGGI